MITWHELIVVGDDRTLRAFVAGFVAGRGSDEPVLFGRDLGVESSTLGERLRDLLVAGSHHVLLTPARVAAALAPALRDAGPETELRLEHHHEVLSASLPFAVEAFSPEVVAKVRTELLGVVPPGVILEGLTEKEERHAQAAGTELYAPAHAFIYRASGRFAGPLPGVLEMHRRASELEFVHVEAIALETREIAPIRER